MFPKQPGLAARQPRLPDEWAEEEGPIPLLDTASLHKRPLLTLGLAVPPFPRGSAWPSAGAAHRAKASCDVKLTFVLLQAGGTDMGTRVPQCTLLQAGATATDNRVPRNRLLEPEVSPRFWPLTPQLSQPPNRRGFLGAL